MTNDKRACQRQTFNLKVEIKSARLDQFLALHFPALSLTRIRRAIREGDVRVNNQRSFQGWVLQIGDEVTFDADVNEPTAALPEPIPLEIIYEDADLLIINKQVNLLTHPSRTEKSGTLMNAVAYHLLHSKTFTNKDAVRPILLHRLDRDTSGAIAIAKNERANRIIFKAWQKRQVTKRYLALVHGVVEKDFGEIDAPIGRNPHTFPRWCVMSDASPSQTAFVVKERFAQHTLLELEPLTGRTHQLRIHCAHIGYGIVGEKIYKSHGKAVHKSDIKAPHQLLHAHFLAFRHPTTGEEMTFNASLPQMMREILEQLKSKTKR
ncbi:MAG: RluA family pseudouridine synthase [Pyrinomonadaceae bacterium]